MNGRISLVGILAPFFKKISAQSEAEQQCTGNNRGGNRIAAIKAEDAKLEVTGSVMASDAFFPFRDGIDAAAAAGITAVIHPGGSMRDQEVIAAADEHKMVMFFTGMRHFRH